MADTQTTAPSVEYVWLGPNAGIKVSNICLGSVTFGETSRFPGNGFPGGTDEAGTHEILDRFYELGGNFIDTANVYTGGQAEQFIGSWLNKHDRHSIVVASKVGWYLNNSTDITPGPYEKGLSRGSILSNLDRSLKRLKTDYIDLYYAHIWDAGTKVEETLRTFNDVARAGKVRYLGVSNVTGCQLQKIVDYSKFMGFDERVVLEQEYSLLERSSEIEIIPACIEEGISLVPFGAQKGGLLTGDFKRDETDVVKALKGTRLGWTAEKPSERTFNIAPNVESYRENEEYWKLMEAVTAAGKAHGKRPAQVAIRWLLQKKFVSSVVVGAMNIQQLEDCMGAGAGWKLTDDEMQQLDDLSSFTVKSPPYPYAYIKHANAIHSRLH